MTTIEVHGNDCRIKLDDKFVNLLDIDSIINTVKENFEHEKSTDFMVKLKLSKDTEMGVVNDIKQMLRRAKVYKVFVVEVDPKPCNTL